MDKNIYFIRRLQKKVNNTRFPSFKYYIKWGMHKENRFNFSQKNSA